MRVLKSKWFWGSFVVIVGGVLIWVWPFLGPLFAYLDNPKRTYSGNCLENVKQMGKAMGLYVLAEDAYPPADGWMDKLSGYLRAADMDQKEEDKKLHCPDAGGGYGYAFNGSLRAPDTSAQTPVVYDSTKPERNAYDATPYKSLPRPERASGNHALFGDGHAGPAGK